MKSPPAFFKSKLCLLTIGFRRFGLTSSELTCISYPPDFPFTRELHLKWIFRLAIISFSSATAFSLLIGFTLVLIEVEHNLRLLKHQSRSLIHYQWLNSSFFDSLVSVVSLFFQEILWVNFLLSTNGNHFYPCN